MTTHTPASRHLPRFNRKLWVLLVSQAVAGSTVPVLFLVSGILGPTISPTLELSTLPVSLVVVGIALGSSFVGPSMSRLGRKLGHIFGLLITMLGIGICWFALTKPDFYLYSFGAFVAGIGSAFNNQVRFTAAETAGDQKALVHSWVLMFGLFAAILGPGVAEFGRLKSSMGEYTGSLAILFGLLLLMTLIYVILFPPSEKSVEPLSSKKSHLKTIIRHPKFWYAVLPGMASFVCMTLLMTATPIEMHHNHHFSHGDTTSAIRNHIIAMYLPSLFGGFLIAKLGIKNLIAFSVLIFSVCIGVGYVSSSVHEFSWSLILLGVGWNFLFLASSTMISQAYDGPDRFTAQGANDTLVYGVQALASLMAGWLIFQIGWQNLVLVPIPLLIAVLVSLKFSKA